jgi:O-antigen/teichoic acid export membrane protein
MSLSRPIASRRSVWETATPFVEAAQGVRRRLADQRTFVNFVLSVAAVNLASLLGSALAFRWIGPGSMGVWHTLLLASSYVTVVRLGLINGMGRELPFALGSGDRDLARRIAATSLGYNAICSLVAGLAFVVPLGRLWSYGEAWRVALPAMAVVSASTLYLTYLQATFRSDSDFGRLARVQWVQAVIGLLMPFMVYAFGFEGLCVHASLQAVVVTAFAHRLRPLRVAPRFEPALARQLVATGFPLFVAAYLQTVATGFDRVILLRRGGVESVGYYAPAVAVLSAMAIVPGAIASYVYPRMSYALGQGRTRRALGRMALQASAVSFAVGLPLAICGWFLCPAVIAQFFPRYAASAPAVRWSLLAGLLWSLSPGSSLLASLKAWRSLWLYVLVVVVARWGFPWFLSGASEPLEGVARGNVLAAALAGVLTLVLVWRAAARLEEAAE